MCTILILIRNQESRHLFGISYQVCLEYTRLLHFKCQIRKEHNLQYRPYNIYEIFVRISMLNFLYTTVEKQSIEIQYRIVVHKFIIYVKTYRILKRCFQNVRNLKNFLLVIVEFSSSIFRILRISFYPISMFFKMLLNVQNFWCSLTRSELRRSRD